MTYHLRNIQEITGGKLSGKSNPVIRNLLLDSRSLVSPADSLFFAIQGERHNGHDFIEELYRNGVRNFIVSQLPAKNNNYSKANFILVKNTLTAMQQLAAHHRRQFEIPVIGITGSNGKTIVKEWLFQLLQDDHKIVRSPKSYNSQVGVPLSVWLMNKQYDIAVFEAGISQPGEMEKLQKIIKPTIGIITNIGDAHQKNFKSLEQKVVEKIRLFTASDIIIYCRDYGLIDQCIRREFPEKTQVCWSKKSGADLTLNEIKKQAAGTCLTAMYRKRKISVTIPFQDDASIENAMHCWLLLLTLGYKNGIIAGKMMQLTPVAMRLELKQGINNCTLINDSYNSDIGSLTIALDFMNQQQQHPEKIIILSDILQSGRSEDYLYREVNDLLKKKNVSRIIGVGEGISWHAGLFTIKKNFFKNTDDLLQKISTLDLHDATMLIKGARNFGFEKISSTLQKKVHKTVLEINLNAVINNLNYFRSKLLPSTRIMVMVKALSYGSGTYEIANLLQYHRVNYLGVAFPDEGMELRKSGISLPIMVLNPDPDSFDMMIEQRLEPEIYSFDILQEFYHAVLRNNVISFPVHIELETGMNRLGFMEHEINRLSGMIKQYHAITVQSVFSHLAASEDPAHDKFTKNQISLFEKNSNRLLRNLPYPVMRHILNSAGIERFPEAQYDLVRLGIGLYGISATGNTRLTHISSLKSTISQIKKLKSGDTVGYGRKAKIKKETIIGIIPIGYADGLNRNLGNGNGKFLVKSRFAPITGNICMDMCMIDITGINAKEGDEVVIFGDDYPITRLAEQLGTIPYEILTGISERVKRVYYHE